MTRPRIQFGAGDRTRTDDSLLGKQVLYQLSYARLLHQLTRSVALTRREVHSNDTSRKGSVGNRVVLIQWLDRVWGMLTIEVDYDRFRTLDHG